MAQPEFNVAAVDPSNVTVPVPEVNVPELVHEPPTVKVPVEEAVRVPSVLIVTPPSTLSVGSLVSAVRLTLLPPALPTVTLLDTFTVPLPKVKASVLPPATPVKLKL